MARIRDCLIQETTRHGKIRYMFHRRPDGRRITIAGEPGQTEFERRYQALLAGADMVEEHRADSITRIRKGIDPQTLGELFHAYVAHLDNEQSRGKIAVSTRQHYCRLLQQLVDRYGSAVLTSIEERDLLAMLDRHGPTANTFNNHLRAVKSIFAYAKKYHRLSPNPAQGLEKINITTDGFPEWEDADIERFVVKHPLGTKAYLALMLLMHVAPRRSDLVKLGPSNIIERGGMKMVSFKPQKTARSSNIQVILPLHPELEEAIQHTRTGPETFMITEFGRPFTSNGFGNKMADWRDAAGIRKGVASHGMRKTVGINLAEHEASPYEIMATLGHSSPKVTEIYTKAANRRKLAAGAASKSTLSAVKVSGPRG
jgi:integrase